MRLLTNLIFKVTLSSMILTAPAMRTGNTDDGGKRNLIPQNERTQTFYSSVVIRKYVDHPSVKAMRAVMDDEIATTAGAVAAMATNGAVTGATTGETRTSAAVTTSAATIAAATSASANNAATTAANAAATAASAAATAAIGKMHEMAPIATSMTAMSAEASASKRAELRFVINQASRIYTLMKLDSTGLDEKAFEYAWRGYHNLLHKRMIRKRSVLSIVDFSQSSCSKRLYVIDVRHKKLLYRTYVAHGQNSGEEYASSFSNEPDSYKSSLGFYVTQWTYIGHNGLSLKLNGVDSGYNDMAAKRNIVLHGSTYVSDRYMQEFGTLGTSLGCPAIPSAVSGRIIRTVKGGSCLFIYHPTPQYLDNSSVING
jgi:hypothetical protein